MDIILSASTGLREGLHIKDDKKVESIEAGQDVFSGYLCYGDGRRADAEEAVEVGNYIIRKSDKDEFYTVIESEIDPIEREIYFYAESAGLDLIGEIFEPYEATSLMSLAQYAERWLYDTGFEVGVDESSGTKMLKWDDSETATARIISTAKYFDCEASYRFDIDRLSIVGKYIDFYAQRGQTVAEPLRKGRDFESMKVSKSIADIATALRVTGGTPDGAGIQRSSDSTYTWVKFSEYYNGYDEENSPSMQDDPDGMQFIGISPAHPTDEESDVPTDYLWAMIKKATGIYAIPSATGYRESKDISGKARYTWVMFATDENGSSMSDSPTDRSYIGLALHKTTATKGTLASQYTWYPMDTNEGCRDVFVSPSTGAISEGNGLYTWIKFADDPDGTNMSDSPKGRGYIGMACHQDSSTESTDASDYDWQLITLNSTTGGIVLFNPCYQGIRQSDDTFIWVRFAADTDGTNMAGTPNNRPYLGLAYGQTTVVQSTDPEDYEWDLIDADTSSEVTLKGMDYNDGDFWIDSVGRLRSEVAREQWSRYIIPTETGTDVGHIVGEFTSEATNQDTLLQEAIAELTKRREAQITYEIELITVRDDLSIGDTVSIVDHEGDLYLTARLLKLETCEEKNKRTATFGDFAKAPTTLSDQVAALRKQADAPKAIYQWIVYADSATGDNIRLLPDGALYMGIAYNKTTSIPDLTDPFVYEWSQIGSGENNILSVTWYYLLQDESLNPPTSPTEETPTGWSTTEPDYTEGSSDALYTVTKTTYLDGNFEYSEVSLSSSYTAAKTAYEKAEDAEKVATNYLSVDSSGIMVADMSDGTIHTPSGVPSGVKNVFIDNDSFDVRDGQTVLASFGETSQIGADGGNHQIIDSTGLQGINEDGLVVFDVQMDGALIRYRKTLVYPRDGEDNPPYITLATTTVSGDSLVVNDAPPLPHMESERLGFQIMWYVYDPNEEESGDPVYDYDYGYYTFGFYPNEITTKHYTLRRNNSDYAFIHVAHTDTFTFSIEGTISEQAVSDGNVVDIFAEHLGYTIALRSPAFSLGTRGNDSLGSFSGVVGESMSASSAHQFACGKYNSEDPDYAFMVGNGTYKTVSNALAVTWDGDALLALDTTAESGTTDGDLYSAITALGWESEVIT